MHITAYSFCNFKHICFYLNKIKPESRADQISHTLPTTRHRCNLDSMGLGAKPRRWAPLTQASIVKIWFFFWFWIRLFVLVLLIWKFLHRKDFTFYV